MKALTLTEVVVEECKDQEFNRHFQREMLINDIAKMVIQLRQQVSYRESDIRLSRSD